MQQVLSEVEQGLWKGVLVVEVERLARGDTVDQGIIAQTFKFSNTLIVTPAKIYDPNNEMDENFFEFGLFMSRQEYKTINRRLQRGRLSSVMEGRYVASHAPFGYKRVKIDKGYSLNPIPEQADIVRLIYQLYTQPERIGAALIARRLNELHILPQKGGDWVPGTVRDILRNPVYAGMIRWNWRPVEKKMSNGQIIKERPHKDNCIVVKGLHPAIIDNKTFELAKQYMSHNPPRPVGERYIVNNPLAGLVVCGKCGRKMQRRPYGNRQPASLICATSCDNVSSALHLVESRILSALSEWLGDYRLKWSVPENTIDINDKALKKIIGDIADINTQINSLHDLLEKGVYDTDTFFTRSRILNDRLKECENAKQNIESKEREKQQREVNQSVVIPKVERLLDVYAELPVKEKNDLLKEVLEKVVYLKTVNGRWHNKPDEFTIDIYPKIPHV
jgi:DNA invertase Pin-like site-specific DNA recombinase